MLVSNDALQIKLGVISLIPKLDFSKQFFFRFCRTFMKTVLPSTHWLINSDWLLVRTLRWFNLLSNRSFSSIYNAEWIGSHDMGSPTQSSLRENSLPTRWIRGLFTQYVEFLDRVPASSRCSRYCSRTIALHQLVHLCHSSMGTYWRAWHRRCCTQRKPREFVCGWKSSRSALDYRRRSRRRTYV